MYEQSVQAQEQARGLLLTLTLLVRAVRDGGQVSEIRLDAVLDDVLRLLHEVGGFDEAIRRFQRDLGEYASCPPPRHDGTKLQLLVLQKALKFAEQTDPPLREHVDDLYRFTMKTLRELGPEALRALLAAAQRVNVPMGDTMLRHET